jgi:hypothetical protein
VITKLHHVRDLLGVGHMCLWAHDGYMTHEDTVRCISSWAKKYYRPCATNSQETKAAMRLTPRELERLQLFSAGNWRGNVEPVG